MSDFNWTELPAEITESKKAKRDTLTREEIPAPILAMAQRALEDQEFHYQPLPHKDLASDFLKFIRAAGDFTEPKPCTVLAKIVEEYKDKDGKTRKVTRGAMVRYSAGQRRGQKDNGDSAESAAEGTENAAEGTENTEGTESE